MGAAAASGSAGGVTASLVSSITGEPIEVRAGGGRGGTYILYIAVVTSMTMGPGEDGALFLSE